VDTNRVDARRDKSRIRLQKTNHKFGNKFFVIYHRA